MKVLFVSAVFPYPLYSGGQVRIYQLLKRLSAHHEITLASFIRNEKEHEYISKLPFLHQVKTVMRGGAWQPKYVFSSLVSDYPFLYATYNNGQMRQFLREEAPKGYDLIHVEPGYVWLSVPQVGLPVVVSEHNIEHAVYARYADHATFPFARPLLSRDVKKMKQWEKRIWNEATAVTAASVSDVKSIHAVAPKADVAVVSNGVDIDEYPFRPKKTRSTSPTLLYVGTFAWMQNVDAVSYLLRALWPEVMKEYPGATLRIIGKNPPPSLVGEGKKNVEWLSEVADIRKEYHSADMLLAPIRIGGGTKYKIIESMASGLPVITTKLGAEGMPVSHKKEVWIAETAQEVLESIHDIVRGTGVAPIVARARKVVENQFHWDSIASSLNTVWKRAYESHH